MYVVPAGIEGKEDVDVSEAKHVHLDVKSMFSLAVHSTTVSANGTRAQSVLLS
jgi:hypothetical protein